jgi:hypothetical protein
VVKGRSGGHKTTEGGQLISRWSRAEAVVTKQQKVVGKQNRFMFSNEGEPVLLEILDARNFLLSSLSSVMKEQDVALP